MSRSAVNRFPSDTWPFYARRGIPKISEPNQIGEKNYFLLFLPFRFFALGASTVSSPSVSTFTLRFFFDFPSADAAAGFAAAFGLQALTRAARRRGSIKVVGNKVTPYQYLACIGSQPGSAGHLLWTSQPTSFASRSFVASKMFFKPNYAGACGCVCVWGLGYIVSGSPHQNIFNIDMEMEGKSMTTHFTPKYLDGYT